MGLLGAKDFYVGTYGWHGFDIDHVKISYDEIWTFKVNKVNNYNNKVKLLKVSEL